MPSSHARPEAVATAPDPRLPEGWIHTGVVLAVIGSTLTAGDTLPTRYGFGDELWHPLLGTLGTLTTTVFWFWLLAPCATIALGLARIVHATISWLTEDLVRPRRT